MLLLYDTPVSVQPIHPFLNSLMRIDYRLRILLPTEQSRPKIAPSLPTNLWHQAKEIFMTTLDQ